MLRASAWMDGVLEMPEELQQTGSVGSISPWRTAKHTTATSLIAAHLGTAQFHMSCLLILQTQTKSCLLCSSQLFLVTL